MIIMAINAGSSSLKFQILEMPAESVLASGVVERIGQVKGNFKIKYNGLKETVERPFKDHLEAVEYLLESIVELKIISSLDEIKGVGHRVVHGGESFSESVLITEDVVKTIESLNDLAPLHNPANITGIRAMQTALEDVPMVAVFDTAFHQTMTKDAYLYALPYEWYEKYGVRKYGFHGTSHRYVAQAAADFIAKDIKDIKTIVCHIGNGASICAVDKGISIDTSMGFTPLAGIPMGTRSGDIDPAIIDYIADKEHKTLKEITSDLNKKSGYLGLSGISSDSRDITDACNKDNEKACLALQIQAKHIANYIGAYYLALGGCDTICFTAGIGENSPETRRLIIDHLHALGIKIDVVKNETRGEEAIISTEDSKVKVLAIPTNEELVIARDTLNLI